jgi:hypothetical protein
VTEKGYGGTVAFSDREGNGRAGAARATAASKSRPTNRAQSEAQPLSVTGEAVPRLAVTPSGTRAADTEPVRRIEVGG